MYYFSLEYMYLLIPAIILAIYAQSKVKGTFDKYSKISNHRGYTGADIARALLNESGIYDVQVEQIAGSLTDHYDPRTKVLRLSQTVYNSNSLSAVGVAAHETGHAVQHSTGYAFLALRSIMAPVTSISSRMAMPLIFVGILLSAGQGTSFGYQLIQLGIILFAVAVAFAFVTLPVEFNASRRAVSMLSGGYLLPDEIEPVKKVLGAAALTYVASAAVALANLLRMSAMFSRRR